MVLWGLKNKYRVKRMNIDEIYKLLETREEKILKQLTMELEKFSEKLNANIRLLIAENDKSNMEKIGELSEKVNNINYRSDESERNCKKCQDNIHEFKRDISKRVEIIEKTANTATGMGILIKIIIGSGLIGFIFMAGQMYSNSSQTINSSADTHMEQK